MPEMGNLIADSASGLAYRVRAALAGDVQEARERAALPPRLLLLHGVGSNEQDMGRLAEFIQPEIEVVSVRAPNVLGPQQYAWFQVNFGANGPAINATQAEASRAKLLALLADLETKDGSGPTKRKTVIAGFSQGGIMSASVALTSPASVNGFAILSGRILPEIAPLIAEPAALASLSAFIAHGELDNKLPPVWAQRADALLTELRVPHRTEYYSLGHELNHEVVQHFTQWLTATLGI